MNDSNAIQNRESTSTRVNMTDYSVDLPSMMRQIRLCRSTLGAILDELECVDASADTIEKIAECTIGVTAEIESLWQATKKFD